MGGTIAMELALRHARVVRSLPLACTWAAADARFLHMIESWIALAYRVPVEERLRHVVYPWLFAPPFFATNDGVTTAISARWPTRTRRRRRPWSGRARASPPGTDPG
jgi:pimeloyl-ACP methyl ester carboxylesterase